MAKQKKEAPRYYTKALRCPDGSRKYIRGKTKEELEKKVMQAQAELGMGINLNDNTTVVQFAQMWVDVYKRPKVKPQSLDVTLNYLNTHILPVIGGKRIRDVHPADCATVLSKMSGNGKAKSTVADVRCCMKEMFECAVDNNLIVRNPVRRSVAASGKESCKRRPLSEDQLDQLCTTTASRPKLAPLHTFVMLVRYTGLRTSEALGLHTSNINFAKAELYVKEQYFTRKGKSGTTEILKSDSANRTLPIPLPLLAHLTTVCKERGGGYLFDVSWPGLYNWVHDRLRSLCRLDHNGEPRNHNPNIAVLDFYVHPHLLRHTYATTCIQNGLPVKSVQYLLGHSDPSMTLAIYTHYEIQLHMESTAEKLNSVFAPNIAALG